MANLTSKQAKFVASYQINHNSTESAKNAGYSPKTADVVGCQLLKNKKIISELEHWRLKKTSEVSKADFVDMALNDYKALDIVEPNKPRFLDIAGKALGYLGANTEQKSQTINNLTQININGAESKEELWEMTRKMIGNE